MSIDANMLTGKQKLAIIFRKRLKSGPWTNARKLMELGELNEDDILVIRKKLGFYKARNLLTAIGIDVDYIPGYDDGEWIEPRKS